MTGSRSLRAALLQACGACIAIVPAGTAFAQTGTDGIVPPAVPGTAASTLAETPAVQVAQNGSPGQITDIVVTARKRGESILQVPVAITALDASAIAARGIRDLNGLNDFTPGLRYENSAANRNDRSFYTITMRGMYPGDSPNRPAATVFVDGVPIPGGALPGLSDVERVEVVKGPQSAYFGRATFSGAINFITTPPSLTDYKAHASVSYESYGTTDDSLTIEGPIVTDKLAIRVTGRFYHTDGQYLNAGFGGRLGERETKSISTTLIAKPIEDLTIRAYFTAWKDEDGPSAQAALTEQDFNCNVGGTARPLKAPNYFCGGIGSVNPARLAQSTVVNGHSEFSFINAAANIVPTNYLDHLGLKRNEYQANLTAGYDLGGYTISGSVGKNRNQYAVVTDTYNRPPDGTGYYSAVFLPYNIHNISSELRVATNGSGPFKAMIGGNYYHESIKFEGRAYRNNAFTQLSQPTNYVATTFGIFGSASYDITDQLTLSGEARYQRDRIHHIVMIANGFNQQATFKSFSPRVILDYKLTPLITLYGSYARGTRPGTFNSAYAGLSTTVQALITASAGQAIPVAVPEEKLTTYEAGLKGSFFDRRLRLLVDGYYGQWRDRQINQNIAYTIGASTSTATVTFPSGRTNLWGVEAETTLKVTPEFTLDGTFNWAHTKVLYTQCAECVAVNGIVNPVGNLMERYPEYSGTASASYSRPLTRTWNAIARLDYIYTGKQYATEANVAYLKAANRFNLSGGIENGSYRIELFGRNIFNNKVPSNILRNANPSTNVAQGANLVVLAPADKASFGVRGSVKF